MLKELRKIKEEEIVNHWKDSENEWLKNLPAKTKGSVAERAFIRFMERKGHKVEKPINRDHDCIVDGRKKEDKVSCCTIVNGNPHTFTFFQVRQMQDYDDLVFICVYPDKIEVFEIDKKDFTKYIHETKKGVVIAGGKEKKDRLLKEHGEDWMLHNDLFHWMKSVNDEWPEGTRRII